MLPAGCDAGAGAREDRAGECHWYWQKSRQLAARAAAKTRAKRILTLNQREFDRLEAIFDVQATSP